MTLGELRRSMSSREFVLQQQYDVVLANEREHAEAATRAQQAVRKV